VAVTSTIQRVRQSAVRRIRRARARIGSGPPERAASIGIDRALQLSDLALGRQVLELEPFRRSIAPQRTDPRGFRSAAVIAPHQDDDMIGCGGSLALLRDAGARLDLIFATDGELRGWESGDSVSVRRAEATSVSRRLGGAMHEIGVPNLTMAVEMSHLDKLTATLADVRPELLLVPWLLDSPLKHRLVVHLASLAVLRAELECEVWQYEVHSPLIASVLVDITSIIDEKRALIRLYTSQVAGKYAYDHYAVGRAAWNARLAGFDCRYAEIYMALPSQVWAETVCGLYGRDLTVTYADSLRYIEVMTDLLSTGGDERTAGRRLGIVPFTKAGSSAAATASPTSARGGFSPSQPPRASL
jgi:LmbE family N-acetylglucosaminyl deacetylase